MQDLPLVPRRPYTLRYAQANLEAEVFVIPAVELVSPSKAPNATSTPSVIIEFERKDRNQGLGDDLDNQASVWVIRIVN